MLTLPDESVYWSNTAPDMTYFFRRWKKEILRPTVGCFPSDLTGCIGIEAVSMMHGLMHCVRALAMQVVVRSPGLKYFGSS